MPHQTAEPEPAGRAADIVCLDSEVTYRGIPASPGIAMGVCIVMKSEGQDVISLRLLPEESRVRELERYQSAVQTCLEELRATYQIAEKEIGNVASILESYQLILSDFSINEAISQRILSGFPAENAVLAEYDENRNILKSAKDPMLRDRASDLDNVKDRLVLALHNRQSSHTIARNSIVITPSIIPQDVILFNESEILAYVTEVGGLASHSSILARSLSLPAVIGVKNITSQVQSGSAVIVDGDEGVLILHPKAETIERYERLIREGQERTMRLAEMRSLPTETSDGHQLTLMANIDSPDEVSLALANGAEGIGLVRTEMLILRIDRFPDEDEQTEWYSTLAERSYPYPLTLRAFDLGTDKFISGLPHEKNPALGIRGVRFLLNRPDIFKRQIRAVLRASQHKNVRFLLPMVTRISEIEDTMALIDEAKNELATQNIAFDDSMSIGIMIETPASALLADKFAEMVDFFSIGTNDLTQYTLAADRNSDLVSGIFDSFNPAVLRLMKQAVEAAQKRGIRVSVCGEFGGHSAATELLIGMGVDTISVNAPLLSELKHRILKSSYSSSRRIFTEAMECLRPSDVRKKVSVIKHRS